MNAKKLYVLIYAAISTGSAFSSTDLNLNLESLPVGTKVVALTTRDGKPIGIYTKSKAVQKRFADSMTAGFYGALTQIALGIGISILVSTGKWVWNKTKDAWDYIRGNTREEIGATQLLIGAISKQSLDMQKSTIAEIAEAGRLGTKATHAAIEEIEEICPFLLHPDVKRKVRDITKK